MGYAKALGPYLAWTLGASAVLLVAWHLTGWKPLAWGITLMLAASLFLMYFFRDPVRTRRPDPAVLLAPADGIVHRFHRQGNRQTIEIFLRIYDVHIQRAPADGKVLSVRYTKGGYLPANVAGAGTRNTRCEMVFATKHGRMGVTQVAGLIARKVESWMKVGQTVRQGEQIGIIHMGSQCRLEIPASARIIAKKGQKIYGGITVLAMWGR